MDLLASIFAKGGRLARLLVKHRGNPRILLGAWRAWRDRDAMARVLDPHARFFGDYMIGATVPARPLQPPPRRFEPSAMTLNWLIPRFPTGSGGMMNVFRIAQELERRGHTNVFWLHNPHPLEPPDLFERRIVEHFQPLRRYRVHDRPAELDRIDGDAVIATDFTSAYWARGVARVRERFYFIQDHEPDFYPAGYAALYARQTYRMGFNALANGAWIHQLATERYGMWSAQWDQAADPHHYHPPAPDVPREPGRIAFYARFETPRRAVELGLLAFEILHRRGVAFHVDLFGGAPPPIRRAYGHTDHGVLGAAALGALYRRAALGMVFSATNYSIIPREMMACGLPVVELDLDSPRLSLGEGAALVEPDPPALADTLQELLADPARRHRLGERGLAFSRRFSWEASGAIVERALIERITAAEAPRAMAAG